MKHLSALTLLALSLSAAPLPPGSPAQAPVGVGTVNTPFLDSGTLNYSASSGTATGTLRQAVFQAGPTVFDFYFQIVTSSGSTSSITRLILRGFQGYTVDASQSFGNPGLPFLDAASSVAPVSVDRPNPGNQIRFDFPDPPTDLLGNMRSSILILRVSDATGYGALPGTTGVGASINGSFFGGQFAPTPEPAFYGATVVGLAGLFWARRRKTAQQ